GCKRSPSCGKTLVFRKCGLLTVRSSQAAQQIRAMKRVPPGSSYKISHALSRTPRTATVLAEDRTMLLEIRWQGLRDLMRRAPEIREHIERTYRENSL